MSSRKTGLAIYSTVVIAAITAATIHASQESNVIEGFRELLASRWGTATLMDAYFAFITFYIFVYYREKNAIAKGVWLVLILGLGNIAMSSYLLIELARLPRGAGIADLLARKS